MSQTQRAFFDERAASWEERLYPPPVRERLERLAPVFAPSKGACVLDVGSGTGVLLPYLDAAVGPTGRIAAFDVSFNMIRLAGDKSITAPLLLAQADAAALPFDDGVFDHIVLFACFPHFDDKAAVLAEMARAAKREAALVVAHLLSREELARHHGGEKAVADDVLPNAAEMRRLFLEAGFSSPEIIDEPGRYTAIARRCS